MTKLVGEKEAQYDSLKGDLRKAKDASSAANLKIIDYDLKNRWTIVSKHHYDLSTVNTDETAIDYALPAVQSMDDNLSLTTWFSPVFDTTDKDSGF